MRFLFVHQNFPGQFRHIIKALADDPQHQVIGIGDAANSRAAVGLHPRVKLLSYPPPHPGGQQTHPYLRDQEGHVRRGQQAMRLALNLKKQGFMPDLVVVHPSWGEGLFLKEVYPDARHIHYCEFFYHAHGADVGFDPEFPASIDSRLRVSIRNSTALLSLTQCDAGISPTRWQRSRYPAEYQSKISVLHEGIDTAVVKPDPQAILQLNGNTFRAGERIVTFAVRNLEPYRGFHQFIRALPHLQAASPEAQFIIAGGDGVSYGRRLPTGETYRRKYCSEVADQVDWSRVHFAGKLPYAEFLRLLQISAAHVYLTYPFVLSWSMLEAMASGCLVIGSSTACVQEVITHGENGLLVDFFDPLALAQQVALVLDTPERFVLIRTTARQYIQQHFDLHAHCLPAWKAFVEAQASQSVAATAAKEKLKHAYARGNDLHRAGDLTAAHRIYDSILQHAPDHIGALGDRGNVRLEAGDVAGAEEDFRAIVAARPEHYRALQSLGNLMRRSNRLEQSASFLRRSLASKDSPSAHWDLAYTLLLMGRYQQAWPHFDYRHAALGLRQPDASKPRWDGAPVTGILLVLDEQGLGDTLQFLRFLPDIPKTETGRVIFAGKPEVLSVVRRVLPQEDVFRWDEALPHSQSWIPLMSLPERLGIMQPEQLPPPATGALVEAARVERWHARVRGDGKLPVVGLCWRGNNAFSGDAWRSPGLAPLLPILAVEDLRFVSLQVGPGRLEIAELGRVGEIVDLGAAIEETGSDMLDTLAILRHCDFAISSCTSVAHMVGLSGVPGCVLLPNRPDWRWMTERSDSPWYPSLKLVRQSGDGTWNDVALEAAKELGMWRDGLR